MLNVNIKQLSMDLSDSGKWRKSKVESFIRRHLNPYDLGMTRYYEMCMWDNKGTLLPRYAILMDNSVVLTENPPKSVVHTIPLFTIRDLSLVADRHSLIKGRNNNSYICQHISITYESPKKKVKSENSSDSSKSESTSNSHLESSSRSVSPLNSYPSGGDTEEDKSSSCSGPSDTDLSTILDSRLSDAPLSPSPSSLNESFIAQTLNAYEPTLTFSADLNGLLFNCDSSALLGNLYYPRRRLEHLPSQLILNEWLAHQSPTAAKRRNNSKERVLAEYNGRKASSRSWMSTPTTTSNDSDDQRSKLWSLSSRMGFVKRKGLAVVNKPNSPIREINGISEQRENRLKQRDQQKNADNLSNMKTTTSSSSSSSSSTVDSEQERGNKDNNGVPTTKKSKPVPKTMDKVDVIHLYFYQRDSEFLNELSLLWNRQQLKNTEKQEEDIYGNSKTLTVNKSLRAAEKVISRVAQDWYYFEETRSFSEPPHHHHHHHHHHEHRRHRRLSAELGYVELLRKVAFLHKCLMRYQQLKYLCWKNAVVMAGLVRAMLECLQPLSAHTNGDPEEIQEALMDKVGVYAILMDIFRTLYEACGVSWFKETRLSNGEFRTEDNVNEWEGNVWDYKMTIFDVTRKLLSSILRCPFLPVACDVPPNDDNQSFVTVVNPQRFVKTPWLTLREESTAKMIKLVCTAHNASVALLFELLAIVHFLPSIIEKTLVTSGIRQMNLERFIRLSVTQIINLLWSNHDPMSASQTMLLYRQVWNLRNLLKHDNKILDYIRYNFCEEFQYYVHTKGIKSRIPDKYTIKPKVIDVCEQLCEDIVGKPGLKS